MISKASKCNGNILQTVADLAYNNQDFRNENFPACKNSSEVKKALISQDSWHVFNADGVIAIFKLQLTPLAANVEQVCVDKAESLETVIPKLRDDLSAMKVSSISLRIPSDQEEPLTNLGFSRLRGYTRYSRVPEETKMMPILPTRNATRKDLSVLSQLMFDAYSKTAYPIQDTRTAEKVLQSIMSGVRGEFVSEASFVSGAASNLVSACFITKNSAEEAEISELFTHPLYRARGLATTEIALAMNRLAAEGVRKLVGWNVVDNAIVSRLLTKLGFGEDRRVTEMVIRL